MPEIEVREDTALSPTEKETLIGFAKDDERLRIHSEQAAVVRWLYSHPDYQEDDRRVTDGAVRATTGTLPVGALKLSGSPRKATTPSSVCGKLPDDD